MADARTAWLTAENEASVDPNQLDEANRLRTRFREIQDAHRAAMVEAQGLVHPGCGGLFRLFDTEQGIV